MEINHYRQGNSQGTEEAWQAAQFTQDNELTRLTVTPLVSINGQPYITSRQVTFLTGRETCRAHHLAKHLAIQLLRTPSSQLPVPQHCCGPNCRVLWIDTLHSVHDSAAIYRELAAHAAEPEDLHFVCLDVLGSVRQDYFWLNLSIENLIHKYDPQLVVIDDIDNLMPHCGINVTNAFWHVMRDTTNHGNTAFLLIGYNNIGKNACTGGQLSKRIFYSSNNIFSLSTRRDVTTVHHVSGLDLSRRAADTEYRFTIGPDNLPQQDNVPSTSSGIDDSTLRQVIPQILTPGQAITPEELLCQVKSHCRNHRQQERATAILTQALTQGLLIPTSDNQYTLPQREEPADPSEALAPPGEAPASQSMEAAVPYDSAVLVNGDGIAVPEHQSVEVVQAFGLYPRKLEDNFNDSLTLPPHNIYK